jgi:hypothetical protein
MNPPTPSTGILSILIPGCLSIFNFPPDLHYVGKFVTVRLKFLVGLDVAIPLVLAPAINLTERQTRYSSKEC